MVDDRIRARLKTAGGWLRRCRRRADRYREAAVGRIVPEVFLALRAAAELGQSGPGLRIVPRDGEERHRRIGILLWNPLGHRNLGAEPGLDITGERNTAIFERFLELVRDLVLGAGIGEA